MRKLHKLAFVLVIGLIVTGCDSSVSLFDGKSLEGWECDPLEQAGDWKAVDGELLGENPGEHVSILWTNRKFRDFEVEMEYIALVDDYDTGIFIRGLTHQVQIGISRSLQKDMTACQTDKVTAIHKMGEWNHLKVIVTGLRIQTLLNDEPMVDYTGVVLVDEGPIGLQLHGGVHMSVKFKNIKVREL
jgi:hypothetical protein